MSSMGGNQLNSTHNSDYTKNIASRLKLNNLNEYEKCLLSDIVFPEDVKECFSDIVGLESQVDLLQSLIVQPNHLKKKQLMVLFCMVCPAQAKHFSREQSPRSSSTHF